MYWTSCITGLIVVGTVAGACSDESLTKRSSSVDATAQSAGSSGIPQPTSYRLLGPESERISGRPSPDGKLWVFSDERGIVVRDLGTRQERVVMEATDSIKVGKGVGSRRWYEQPRFSGDGSALEFVDVSLSRVNGALRLRKSVAIATRPLAGGETRTLLSTATDDPNAPQPIEWSSGGTVAVGIRSDEARTHRIVRFNPDGRIKDLKSFDWRAPENLALSPDGRFLAYNAQRDEKSAHHDVLILAMDLSRELVIAAHPADDRVIGWAPDGQLLIASDRFGTMGLFALRITDGRQQGEPEVIASDLHRFIGPLAISSQGTVYYQVQPTGRDVYAFTIDPNTMQVVDPPSAVGTGSAGENDYPIWSPDGRTLAYVSYGRTRQLESRIVLQSLENGQVREIRPDMAWVQVITPLPGGKALLARGRDMLSRNGLFEVQIPSGAVRPLILNDKPALGRGPRVSVDGEQLYFVSQEERGGTCTWTAMSRVTGVVRQIRQFDPGQDLRSFVPSPDESRLAFVGQAADGRWHIAVLPGGEGDPRIVYTAPAGQAIAPASLNWMGDRYLMFMTRDAASQQVAGGSVVRARGGRATERLWRVSLHDGPAVQSNFSWREFAAVPVLHPDGRRIVFQSGLPSYEVWAFDRLPTANPR